jgi:hypothetical protein
MKNVVSIWFLDKTDFGAKKKGAKAPFFSNQYNFLIREGS